MTAPYLGPPTDAPGCAHHITLDQHTCGRAPVVHIAVHTDATQLVQLPSCRRHAAIARASGDLIAEHPYRPGCDTGDCWPTNRNRVVDDRQPRSSHRSHPTADRVLLALLWILGSGALAVLLLGIVLITAGRGQP